MRPRHGFTLVEVMVALFLLSGVALGLTTTLMATQRARVVSEQRMQAVLLAAEGIEQLRAGQALGAVGRPFFERTGTVAPWGAHAGLQRLEVTVTWNDGDPQQLQLVTLARSAR